LKNKHNNKNDNKIAVSLSTYNIYRVAQKKQAANKLSKNRIKACQWDYIYSSN